MVFLWVILTLQNCPDGSYHKRKNCAHGHMETFIHCLLAFPPCLCGTFNWFSCKLFSMFGLFWSLSWSRNITCCRDVAYLGLIQCWHMQKMVSTVQGVGITRGPCFVLLHMCWSAMMRCPMIHQGKDIGVYENEKTEWQGQCWTFSAPGPQRET